MAIHISRQQNRPHTLMFFCFFVFLSVILLIGGTFAWRWMQKPTSFPIQKIEIQGQLTHVTSQQIQKIIQTNLSGGFFSLNVSTAKQAILSFPWIADVSFRRVWPGTLNVKMTEQQAIARFGKSGVLNSEGVVFYPGVKTLPQNLPDLEGPIDQSKALFDFYQTVNPLAKLIGLTVVSLRVNAAQSWSLVLSNQVKVMMGRQEALARFRRFVAIYPKMIASSKQLILSVDLRYANGVAVQYQEGVVHGSQNTLKK